MARRRLVYLCAACWGGFMGLSSGWPAGRALGLALLIAILLALCRFLDARRRWPAGDWRHDTGKGWGCRRDRPNRK